jgi:hypothetical protein
MAVTLGGGALVAEQSLLHGEECRSCSRGDAELGVGVFGVVTCRLGRERELSGGLLVRQPGREESQHFCLSIGEPRRSCDRRGK